MTMKPKRRMSQEESGERLLQILTDLFDGELEHHNAGEVTRRLAKMYNFAFGPVDGHELNTASISTILGILADNGKVALDKGEGGRYIYSVKVVKQPEPEPEPEPEAKAEEPAPAIDNKLAARIGSIEMQLLEVNRKLDRLVGLWTT